MKKFLKGCLMALGVVFALLIALVVFVGGSSDSEAEKKSSSPTPISQEADAEAEEATESEPEAAAEEEPAEEPAEKPAKYEISNESIERDDWSLKITGVLTNNSGHDRNYVQVEYSLYDADGNLIGSAFDNVNNLKDGGSWKFSATAFLMSDELAQVDSYELADISAW